MKFNTIQYLRAASALIVVITHALLHPITYVDIPIRRFGSFGVLLFFVVSGFIIVYTTGKGSFASGNFLRRRIERVIPLYWMVTFGVALMALAAPSLLKNTTFSWGQLVGSLLFIPHAREDGAVVPLMLLGWTLNYEIFFYVSFAIMAPLTAAWRVLAVSTLFLALIVLGLLVPFEAPIPYFYTRPLLVTFCVGMGVGLLYLRKSPRLFAFRMAPLWTFTTVVFLALAFSAPHSIPPGPVTDIPFTFAAASLIMLGLCLEERLPKWNFGVILGDASYSMYLVHMYLVAVSIIIVRKLMGTTVPWLDVSLALFLSVLVAIPIHRFVDKPIHKVLRRLDRGAQRKQPAPA